MAPAHPVLYLRQPPDVASCAIWRMQVSLRIAIKSVPKTRMSSATLAIRVAVVRAPAPKSLDMAEPTVPKEEMPLTDCTIRFPPTMAFGHNVGRSRSTNIVTTALSPADGQFAATVLAYVRLMEVAGGFHFRSVRIMVA